MEDRKRKRSIGLKKEMFLFHEFMQFFLSWIAVCAIISVIMLAMFFMCHQQYELYAGYSHSSKVAFEAGKLEGTENIKALREELGGGVK